ncbi:MAG: hypothetical protein ACM3UT_02620, partial [Chloroflexota bacterium]
MKKIVCILGFISFFTAYGQDLSFSKKGSVFYSEMSNPVKGNPAEWAAVKQDVNVSFASDNIRYAKEKVPVESLSGSLTLQAWKGEKIHTQILIWTKSDLKSVQVVSGRLT